MHRFAVAVQWKLTKRRFPIGRSQWEKHPPWQHSHHRKSRRRKAALKAIHTHTHLPSENRIPSPPLFIIFQGVRLSKGDATMFVREISLAQQRHHWKIKDFQFRTVRVFINYSSAAQLLSHTFYCKFWKKRKKNKGSQVAGTTTHVYERNPSSHPLIKNTCLFAVLYLQLGIVYGFAGCVNWLYLRFAGACN